MGRVLLLLVAAVLVWATWGFLALRGAVDGSNAKITRAARLALAPATGDMLSSPTNVLIVGVDALRGETRPRADTIMIMRLDPGAGRIKYLSVPRDLRIVHPRLGVMKINGTFRQAGQAGLIRAVSRQTGLPINHIMVISFRGFPKLVDDLGGVSVYNATALVNCPYAGGITVSFPKGRITLNGAQALQFARVRKCDTDFQRAARQQALVAAIKGKILTLWGLPMAPWNGASLVNALSTDMGTVDLIKLGWLQAQLKQDPKDRAVLAGTSQTIGGVSYVIEDQAAAARQIRQFVGPT